jgi:hypothetical protein
VTPRAIAAVLALGAAVWAFAIVGALYLMGALP